MVGSEACDLSINRTSTFLRKPWWSRCKNDFSKTFFWHFLCYHSQLFQHHPYSCFIYFWNCRWCYLHVVYCMTYSSTGISNVYRCNQNYVYFIRFFSSEASKNVSNIYALKDLTPRGRYLSFNRISLLLFPHFYKIRSEEVKKKFWTSPWLYKKGTKSLINFPSSFILGW